MAQGEQEVAVVEEELAEVVETDEVGFADAGPVGEGVVGAGE